MSHFILELFGIGNGDGDFLPEQLPEPEVGLAHELQALTSLWQRAKSQVG